MSEENNVKSKALDKDCIVLLLNLIAKHEVIMSKATNATNNKLKDKAWKSIAIEFGALSGERRRPEQLRHKWENLKKAARKRSALIKQNNMKTGGGKAYIPPDEVLDFVAATLGTTCSDMTPEFGGDRTSEEVDPVSAAEPAKVIVVPDLPEQPPPEISAPEVDRHVGAGALVNASGGNRQKSLSSKNYLNKRRKFSEEVQKAQRDRDLALAAYYTAKAERVRLENIKLEIEIKKLQGN